MIYILIVLGSLILALGLYLALKELKPIVFNVMAGFVILLGTGFGLFGKYLQDKNSSQKSDKILESTKAFEGQLDIVQRRLNEKMRDILLSIDSSQIAISSKTQEVEESVEAFKKSTSEGLSNIGEAVNKVDTITNELAVKSNRLFSPIPQIIETNFEISWHISRVEQIIEKYEHKKEINHPHSSSLVYEIDRGSPLYRQVVYAFKNIYLTFKTPQGDIIYGLSVLPFPETIERNDNYVMFKPADFNPTPNARVIYDQDDQMLKIMVHDSYFKLKSKAKLVTSFLDFQNSTVIFNVNDRDDGIRVERNLNVEASEFTDVIFGFGTFGGKQKDLNPAYESLKIVLNFDNFNIANFEAISSDRKIFNLGELIVK